MKGEFTGVAAHGGDVQFYGVAKLPAGVTEVTDIKEKILARGETSGHCHILTGDVKLFKDADGNTFAAVGSDGAFHQHYKESMVKEDTFSINQNISNCDHVKPCPIPEGIYRIGIDQQYDPHAGIWEKNLD